MAIFALNLIYLDMKVVVDNKIPYIKESLAKIADEVVYLPGHAFTAEDVRNADALIVRTRTQCNRELLQGSKVKFIATATIGYDHIDTEYCKEAGIVWTNCPGCNAGAVEQYIHAVLLLLKRDKQLDLKHLCLGVVGVGHVGSRIVEVGKHFGMKVLLNDPPRADQGEAGFVSLSTLAEECDIITFHTPLVREGKYKTYHLANQALFAQCKRKPVLINSSRGEVVDTAALKTALAQHQLSDAVIDTWEHEPEIDLDLLEQVFVGTPHIAGYSADGKANATRMALEALCRFFHKEVALQVVPPALPPQKFSENAEEAYLQLYNPMNDCDRLRKDPASFEQQRGDYPLRREHIG